MSLLAWFTTFQFCRQRHGDSDCVLTKSRARLELSQLTLGRGQCALTIPALGYWDPVGCQLLTFSLALKVILKRYIFIPFPSQLRLREQGHVPKATWLEVAVVRL